METIFVSKRSEVTAEINRLMINATPVAEVFRTRVNCNCTYPFNFRYGALIISNNMVTHKIVRCKQCAKPLNPLKGTGKEVTNE